ncbi:hypothetical protein [Streptomyces sp. NPDC005533]
MPRSSSQKHERQCAHIGERQQRRGERTERPEEIAAGELGR